MISLAYKNLKDNEAWRTLQTEAWFAAELLRGNPDLSRTEALKIAKRKVHETEREKQL